MKAQRIGDLRPPMAKIRNQEYSLPCREAHEQHSRFVSGLERGEADRHLNGDVDVQLRKLSQFNEGLSIRDSPSMKFQWKHLLAEPANSKGNTNPRFNHFNDYGANNSRTNVEKGYHGSGFSDTGVAAKSVFMENERVRTTHPPDVAATKSCGRIDGSFPSPLGNLNVWVRDHLHAEKVLARELYKEEEKPVFYLRDNSHYMMPLSQSKALAVVSSGISNDDLRGSYKDDLSLHSDGFSRSCGLSTEPFGRDGYGQMPVYKSPAEPKLRQKDMVKYQRVHLSPTEGEPRDCTYPEVQRSEKGDLGTLSDEIYGKIVSARDDYGHQDSLRASIVDSIVDKIDVTQIFHRYHLREGGLWDHHLSSQEQPMSNYFDVNRTSQATRQDGEILGSRSTHLGFGTEVYQDRESLHLGEDYGFGRDAHHWSHEERLNRLLESECDLDSYGIDGGPQQRLTAEGLGMHGSSEKMLKRKRGMNKKMTRYNCRSKLSHNLNAFRKIHDPSYGDEQWTGEDTDCLFSSNKSWSSGSQFREARRTFDGIANHRISDSDDWLSSRNLLVSKQRRSGNPHKSGGRDIKKRLRTAPPNVHIPHPLVRKHKPYKFTKRNVDDFHGGLHIQGGDPLESKVSPAKTEPPEESQEFKQLLQTAFFKCVKQLNDNPCQRRRYMEQGKAGSIKCSICGRDSEEFVDTQSLAMHAFMSPVVGFRAQHLGFLKALCALMGWNSAVAPNSPWVCQVLPDSEALALKEDLIIWPPVVIIHNISIGNNDPDERMIVTVEMLNAILRDMGFGGGMSKVCRGKPANQSIMVVSFNGTFSGLQEAGRLHGFYAENKQGRAEFHQMNSNGSNSSSWETRKVPVDKVEHVLYGYLGIAGDLDKLDFETKKRYVVKSKKEIQAIADAPLKTE